MRTLKNAIRRKMKILLLGGTGAMGEHLSHILYKRGDEVYITSRKKRENEEGLHYIHGNAHDFFFLQKILINKWDCIVDFMVYSTEEFKARIEFLLNATKQYIFLSSSRVYANWDNPIKESSPRLLDIIDDKDYLRTDEYALKKAREENILFFSSKKNFTIIRPYITYSENRLQLGDLEHANWLTRALDGRTIVFSEDVASHYTTVTYGFDVAKGIAAVIGTPKALGEVYHITCNVSIKWSEILNIYLNAIESYTGIRPKVKMIPSSIKLKNKRTLFQVKYDRLYDRIFDNSKIMELAPNLRFVSPEEGLKKCIKAYVSERRKPKVSYLEEADRDRITNERIKLSTIKTIRDKLIYICCRDLRLSWFLRIITNIIN